MTKPPPPPERPRRAQLVQQDLRIAREVPEDPSSRVVASVHCARQNFRVEVEDCAGCAHFARIEPHEAGYVLLCGSEPEPEPREESLADDPAVEPSKG